MPGGSVTPRVSSPIWLHTGFATSAMQAYVALTSSRMPLRTRPIARRQYRRMEYFGRNLVLGKIDARQHGTAGLVRAFETGNPVYVSYLYLYAAQLQYAI